MASEVKFDVRIRPSERPGAVQAYADLRLLLPNGEVEMIGFAIVKQPGKKPFVGFPQNRGRNKYFPVVEAKGEIREEMVKAILRAYRETEERE